MAGKYFQKTHLVDFFKRFTTSKLHQQTTTIGKRDAKDNRRIQKVSGLWQYVGWSYYRRQMLKTMGRLFEVSATGRRSLRRAKRNVMQLLADSRKQMKDMFQNEEATKVKIQPNQQFLSTDTVSMMEKGKIRETVSEPQFNPERRARDIMSQYNRDTTFEYEQRFTGSATNSFPVSVSPRNKRTLQFASNPSKLSNAVALRTPEADVPNDLMLTVKSNDEVVKSLQPQVLANKSGN